MVESSNLFTSFILIIIRINILFILIKFIPLIKEHSIIGNMVISKIVVRCSSRLALENII